MAKVIIMPKLDMTMEEGEISSWLVKEGDEVRKGDPLFEVISEKAVIEVESIVKGTVLKIICAEGQTAAVTSAVAIVGKPGEDISSLLGNEMPTQAIAAVEENDIADVKTVSNEKRIVANSNENGKVAATPAAKTLASKENIDLINVETNEQGNIRKQQVKDYLETDAKVKSTPLATKIARDNDIDISEIGSDKSRIYSEDVLKHIKPTLDIEQKGEKLKGINKITAERLTKVWQTIPMVTDTVEVDISKVQELCERFNSKFADDGTKINITDVLIKIMAAALRKNPKTNVSLQDGYLITNTDINISVAVSIEDGLTVPVLKNVDRMGLAEINKAKKDLAIKAREGRLNPDELVDGSMTISNIGMFGVDIFTPLINMPESSILGIGRINKKPVVVNDEIVIRPMMWLSHTFDHRAFDGVPAMKLLGSIRDMIEDPDLLIF